MRFLPGASAATHRGERGLRRMASTSLGYHNWALLSAIIINVRIHTPALLYIHAEIHGPFVSNQRESERAQCRHAPVVIQQSKKEKKKIKTRANISSSSFRSTRFFVCRRFREIKVETNSVNLFRYVDGQAGSSALGNKVKSRNDYAIRIPSKKHSSGERKSDRGKICARWHPSFAFVIKTEKSGLVTERK